MKLSARWLHPSLFLKINLRQASELTGEIEQRKTNKHKKPKPQTKINEEHPAEGEGSSVDSDFGWLWS